MPEAAIDCTWCGRPGRAPSNWEQQNLSGIWQRLCIRCASSRLSNPLNALLPMRKVAAATAGED